MVYRHSNNKCESLKGGEESHGGFLVTSRWVEDKIARRITVIRSLVVRGNVGCDLTIRMASLVCCLVVVLYIFCLIGPRPKPRGVLTRLSSTLTDILLDSRLSFFRFFEKELQYSH